MSAGATLKRFAPLVVNKKHNNMKLLNLFKRKQAPCEWWGYKAIDGTYRAFKLIDIRDYYLVKQSDYCLTAIAPFMALNKQTALQTIKDATHEKLTEAS